LLFRFAPPGGLLPSLAGLSATRLDRFTATLPLLPKSAPPFTLSPVRLICCSTDLRREALRFSFCSSFLAGVQEELEQINRRGRIIPSPLQPAPVKVIRHKPPHGILTTRKHSTRTATTIYHPRHRAISEGIARSSIAIGQSESVATLIQTPIQRFKSHAHDFTWLNIPGF